METMELIHTSPTKIEQITDSGRFGEFLFFSDHVYVMTAGEFVTYSIELDDDQVIGAGRLFFHEDAAKLAPLVAELAARLDVSEDDAEALIAEKKSVFDLDIETEDAGEDAWDVQHFTARAAKILGFRAVRVQDEQGSAYMIDMLDRVAELREV